MIRVLLFDTKIVVDVLSLPGLSQETSHLPQLLVDLLHLHGDLVLHPHEVVDVPRPVLHTHHVGVVEPLAVHHVLVVVNTSGQM